MNTGCAILRCRRYLAILVVSGIVACAAMVLAVPQVAAAAGTRGAGRHFG